MENPLEGHLENSSTRTDWQGKLIGRYQLEKLLGRGAMSEVWLAKDTQLRREVALKMLPAVLNDQAYLRNFMNEARAAAALDHPHILGIHDFGEQEIAEGEVIPYLVMPYVAGGTLATRMQAAAGPLPVPESLRYLRQAALAIDYAHSKRVLHRDIKPANMLLREDWLLLSDFGLARVLGSTTMRGQTAAAAGTPEYMAPEQIMGQARPASDRYSLAVVAYQLFTGRPPFHGPTPAETVAQQMQAPLPPPHQLNPRIPAAVENLLTLALSRNPDLRPPSCLVFVDALQKAWQTGRQTGPSPDSTLIAPWNQRLQGTNSAPSLPAVAGGESSPSLPQPASTPVLPPITGEGFSPSQVQPASTPSRPPVTGGASAPSQASPAFPPAPAAGMTPVLPVSSAGLPPGTAGGRTLTDVNRTAGPPTSGDSFATHTDVRTGPQENLTYPQGMVPYTPGVLERKVGRRAILAGGAAAAVVVVGGGVAALEIVRSRGSSPQSHGGSTPATPTPVGPRKLVPGVPVLQLTGHSDAVWTASWHPGGRYLMTAGKDGSIMLWDIATALQNAGSVPALATPMQKWTVARIKFENLTELVCWSKDGKKLIVSGNSTDKIYVLDAFAPASTPAIYKDIDLATLGDAPIYVNVTAGPLGNAFSIVNTAISGAQVQVWHLDQTEAPVVNYDVKDDLGVLQWSLDGSMLAAMTGGLADQNGFYLWQSSDRYHPRLFTRPQRNKRFTFFVLAETLAWSPVDPHLLLLSDADQALIWDVRKDQPVLVLSADAGTSTPDISKLSWSPDGRYVAASYDPLGDNALVLMKPQIFVWDVQTPLKNAPAGQILSPSLTFSAPSGGPAHTQAILDLRWSPDGRYLATSSFDKSVIIWKVDGG